MLLFICKLAFEAFFPYILHLTKNALYSVYGFYVTLFKITAHPYFSF